MPRGTTKIFKFSCPHCHALNTANCRNCGARYEFDPVNPPGEKRIPQRIRFGEFLWERIKARAIVTPGIGSASEFVRLACYEVLVIPPQRLIANPYWQARKTTTCPKCRACYEFDAFKAPDEKIVQRRVCFPERLWGCIVARAKIIPGVGSAAQFVRLACAEVLAIPPQNLIISSD
jgi:hypothetical protein